MEDKRNIYLCIEYFLLNRENFQKREFLFIALVKIDKYEIAREGASLRIVLAF